MIMAGAPLSGKTYCTLSVFVCFVMCVWNQCLQPSCRCPSHHLLFTSYWFFQVWFTHNLFADWLLRVTVPSLMLQPCCCDSLPLHLGHVTDISVIDKLVPCLLWTVILWRRGQCPWLLYLPPTQDSARAWGLGCSIKSIIWKRGIKNSNVALAMIWGSVFLNHETKGLDKIVS